MKNYDPKKIEGKWQKEWEKKKLFKTKEDPDKKKSYILDMFPYPSGEGLHVGHPKGYIATDIYSRFKKMNGFNILHPMGWDAFGLPAENYAIKNKIHPRKAVEKNIKRFKEQLSILGFNYDWSREINTTDSEYYRWTQWIFLKLLEKGLAYESFEPINWCPSCQTGLANEDVEDGKCERCGTLVEKKAMRQWVLRITKYAERLLADLDALDWPESIKESQRNWIGKSEGAEFDFRLVIPAKAGIQSEKNLDSRLRGNDNVVKVFTTRADTLFGVTYVVLAPEHKLVKELEPLFGNSAEVKKYIDSVKNKPEIDRTAEGKEKTGIELKGIKAVNPANGEELPVWVADYVLASYGTGAVMAVPAHDERDWEFAKKYNLPIRQVVAPYFTSNPGSKDQVRSDKKTVKRKTAYALVFDKKNNKFLCLNWERFGWHSGIIGGVDEGESYKDAAIREIKEETGYTNLKFIGDLGGEQHNHFFAAHKDENRYAVGQGMLFELIDETKTPIAEEHTKNHKPVWIDASQMGQWLNLSAFEYMWLAYKNGNKVYIGNGMVVNSGKFNDRNSEKAKEEITKAFGKQKITYKLRDWVFSRQRYWGEPIPVIHCDVCGTVPVPEKDLPIKLPEVKSYAPTGTGESPLADISKWVNVKCPKCGGKAKRETNTMPQWAGSSWYYLRYMDPKNKKALVDSEKEKYWQPVDMYVGGAEHATRHLIYARFWHKFLFDIGVVSGSEPFKSLKNQGLIMGTDGRKMSKRFGNVVNPDDVVKTYGADTLRIYEMFMGPFNQSANWSTESIIGPRRFLEKVWRLSEKVSKDGGTMNTLPESDKLLHKTIKKVGEDIENFGFNTAVSALMILVNEMEKAEKITQKSYENFLKILSPFAPHITEELWHSLGNKKSIYLEEWPSFDTSILATEMVRIVFQVNSKTRDSVLVASGSKEEEIKEKALSSEAVKKWIEGKEIKKIIYVKNRLLNIVTS